MRLRSQRQGADLRVAGRRLTSLTPLNAALTPQLHPARLLNDGTNLVLAEGFSSLRTSAASASLRFGPLSALKLLSA